MYLHCELKYALTPEYLCPFGFLDENFNEKFKILTKVEVLVKSALLKYVNGY